MSTIATAALRTARVVKVDKVGKENRYHVEFDNRIFKVHASHRAFSWKIDLGGLERKHIVKILDKMILAWADGNEITVGWSTEVQ